MKMKIAGMIIVFLAFSYAGYHKSLSLFQRTKELELFIALIDYIKDEIRYLRMPVPRIISKAASMDRFSDYEVFQLFNAELKSERSVIEAWKKAIKKSAEITKLNDEDITALNAFFEDLGSSDEQGQSNICQITLTELRRQREDSIEYSKKHAKLYRSLGVLAGLFVCVIFI